MKRKWERGKLGKIASGWGEDEAYVRAQRKAAGRRNLVEEEKHDS
jgi:hypothetical protein